MMLMITKTYPLPRLSLAVLLGLAGAAVSARAQVVINFDIFSSGGTDQYNDNDARAGLFDGDSSYWNEGVRTASVSDFALLDDQEEPTGVTISYTRNSHAGAHGLTGAFANLGVSSVNTGTVTLNGLTPGLTYNLAIFSAFDVAPSFTVGAVTKTITPTSDWSNLTAAANYVLFQTVANGSGVVSFTPNNPPDHLNTSQWSAFQLQQVAVPEPSEYAVAFGLLSLGVGGWLRRRSTRVA